MTEIVDIRALGAGFIDGTVNPLELLESHLQVIRQRNPDLNCFVEINADLARKAADAAHRRFRENSPLSAVDGIPIAIKDNINVMGFKTRNGTNYSHSFEADATVISRLRDAGAVIVGKLNMDECALGATADNPHTGRTQNPWRRNYVPGGSSGGAAASVSSGMVLAALGTDTLGSVRLPAAYCGVVGLKPSRDGVSMDGVIPLSDSLDHVGTISRSVQDAALLYSVLSNGSLSQPTIPELNGFRLGVLDDALIANCTNEVAAGFERAKSDLRDRGADIVVLDLFGLDTFELRRMGFLIVESEGSESLSGPLRDHPELYSDRIKSMFAYGANALPDKLIKAREGLKLASLMIRTAFSKVDLIISPTAPQNAFPFSDPEPVNQAELSALANISGCPAISLPCGLDSTGLPLAIQIIAAPKCDKLLLSTAMAFENIWGRLSPPANF